MSLKLKCIELNVFTKQDLSKIFFVLCVAMGTVCDQEDSLIVQLWKNIEVILFHLFKAAFRDQFDLLDKAKFSRRKQKVVIGYKVRDRSFFMGWVVGAV